MTNLYQVITDAYNIGKSDYPLSIVAIEYGNALYFLHLEAELIADLFHKKIDTVHGTPFCIIPKDEHNDLSLCLYENKFLMVVYKTEPQQLTSANFLDYVVENIIKPYNEQIISNFKRHV